MKTEIEIGTRTLSAAFTEGKMQEGGILMILGCGIWQLRGNCFKLMGKSAHYKRELIEFHKNIFARLGCSSDDDAQVYANMEDVMAKFASGSLPSVVAISPEVLHEPQNSHAMKFQKPKPFGPSPSMN